MTEPRSRRRPARPGALPDALRRPLQLALLAGVSGGVYAVTLAGVAVVQEDADRAVAAARAPAVARLAALRAETDRLAAALVEAGGAETAATDAYGEVGQRLAALEDRLASLAARVAEVQGAAAALPARIALPAVPSRQVTVAPRTHATTRASGG